MRQPCSVWNILPQFGVLHFRSRKGIGIEARIRPGQVVRIYFKKGGGSAGVGVPSEKEAASCWPSCLSRPLTQSAMEPFFVGRSDFLAGQFGAVRASLDVVLNVHVAGVFHFDIYVLESTEFARVR